MDLDQQADKQTIALCMIVKDEEDVITRAFDSVKDFVDYYIICDTGSTDNTIKVMKDYWEEHGLHGDVHEHTWVNFGRNRTQCFDLAKGKCDYIMTLDADEVIAPYIDGEAVLTSKIAELPKFDTDMVYATTVMGTMRYQRAQFFKCGLGWHWSEPVHEVCGADDKKTEDRLSDLCTYVTQDGARSKDGNKFKRDALLFELDLIENPLNSRSWFYLAQSYGDAGVYDKALETNDRALELCGWDQEQYISKLRKARWSLLVGNPIEEAAGYFLEAHTFMPTRLEALHDLVFEYSKSGNYRTAAWVGEKGLEILMPSSEYLFVESAIYAWRFKDLMSVAYYYTGRHEEGISLLKELLQEAKAPEKDLERIKNNLAEYDKL